MPLAHVRWDEYRNVLQPSPTLRLRLHLGESIQLSTQLLLLSLGELPAKYHQRLLVLSRWCKSSCSRSSITVCCAKEIAKRRCRPRWRWSRLRLDQYLSCPGHDQLLMTLRQALYPRHHSSMCCPRMDPPFRINALHRGIRIFRLEVGCHRWGQHASGVGRGGG